MFTYGTSGTALLTPEDIRSIRSRLFPEAQIGAGQRSPVSHQDQLLLSLHHIRTMDMQQEMLARQLGDRHRVIRGVSGSGKTLIVASRAKLLAKAHPDWKILVLCDGIPLSRSLRQLIETKLSEPDDLLDYIDLYSGAVQAKANIEVYNFREWLRYQLNMTEDGIPDLLAKKESNEAILPAYDAILIDEGQEFAATWLKLLCGCLNPATQSLLLVEDQSQASSKRKRSLAREVGLDFRGRSRILSINYRNTSQIVQFAWDFYQRFSQLRNKVREGTVEGVELIPPQSTRRKGPSPLFRAFGDIREEMTFVSRTMLSLHQERNVPFEDMAVLYRVKDSHRIPYIDEIRMNLLQHGLPHTWITENEDSKRSFVRHEPTVKISTIDSVKGLDFRAVFIVNVENMPFALETAEEREVALLYSGMTRALDWLFLTCSGESKFTRYLAEAARAHEEPAPTRQHSG